MKKYLLITFTLSIIFTAASCNAGNKDALNIYEYAKSPEGTVLIKTAKVKNLKVQQTILQEMLKLKV
ncbi:cupin [Brachyspira hampsonii 30599]|nr:cupin [Brachyspira hampsonii 30599]